MYTACKMFIDKHAENIIKKKLRYNFLLHLMCLYDYGLIDASQKAELVVKLNSASEKDSPKKDKEKHNDK